MLMSRPIDRFLFEGHQVSNIISARFPRRKGKEKEIYPFSRHEIRARGKRRRLNLAIRRDRRRSSLARKLDWEQPQRDDGPRSIVPLRLFPIQFPRERTSPSISPNREIQPPPFAARANLVAREWINFFFFSFAARKTSGDDIGYLVSFEEETVDWP